MHQGTDTYDRYAMTWQGIAVGPPFIFWIYDTVCAALDCNACERKIAHLRADSQPARIVQHMTELHLMGCRGPQRRLLAAPDTRGSNHEIVAADAPSPAMIEQQGTVRGDG